jgi:hypothetical protein
LNFIDGFSANAQQSEIPVRPGTLVRKIFREIGTRLWNVICHKHYEMFKPGLLVELGRLLQH